MKKVILCITVSALFLSVVSTATAISKTPADQGAKDFVQEDNSFLADPGSGEIVFDGVFIEDSAQICKEGTLEDNCFYWKDGCCNTNFRETDPDCQVGPSFSGGDSVILS